MKRLKRRRGSEHLIAFSSCPAVSAVREELSQHAHLHRPDAAATGQHDGGAHGRRAALVAEELFAAHVASGDAVAREDRFHRLDHGGRPR